MENLETSIINDPSKGNGGGRGLKSSYDSLNQGSI